MRLLHHRVLLLTATLLIALSVPASARNLAGVQDGDRAPNNGWHFVRAGSTAVAPQPVAVTMPDGRTAYDTAFVPYGQVGSITLLHPARIVERIGLHESNHEGARDQEMRDTAASSVVLESRGRQAGRQSAADIVVAPDTELRSPVSGTVIRSGTYTLYCQYSDDFVVIAPDAEPAFEVKLLHIDGVQVVPGDQVIAGVTVIAPRATVLPFGSQVEQTTAQPPWPHTHLEVIDPSIPNVSNGGSGSSC